MKANRKPRTLDNRGDVAVSPVIAVILMVAITVVLAATVYVWVSGLSTQEQGPERASIRATVQDFDGDSAGDWIVLTLTEGANAPYGEAVVTARVVHDGAVKTAESTTVANATEFMLCLSPGMTSAPTCNDTWVGAASDWDVGESLYVACQDAESHKVSIEIRSSAILDNFNVDCDEAAV